MTTLADLRDWQGSWHEFEGELQHVYPLFGRPHVVSRTCWCQPDVEDGVCLHNVEH